MGRAAAIAYAREGADVAINYFPTEEPDAKEVIDLIKAESRVTEANFRRLDEKIEKVENLLLTRLANHDTRIGRLESK